MSWTFSTHFCFISSKHQFMPKLWLFSQNFTSGRTDGRKVGLTDGQYRARDSRFIHKARILRQTPNEPITCSITEARIRLWSNVQKRNHTKKISVHRKECVRTEMILCKYLLSIYFGLLHHYNFNMSIYLHLQPSDKLFTCYSTLYLIYISSHIY